MFAILERKTTRVFSVLFRTFTSHASGANPDDVLIASRAVFSRRSKNRKNGGKINGNKNNDAGDFGVNSNNGNDVQGKSSTSSMAMRFGGRKGGKSNRKHQHQQFNNFNNSNNNANNKHGSHNNSSNGNAIGKGDHKFSAHNNNRHSTNNNSNNNNANGGNARRRRGGSNHHYKSSTPSDPHAGFVYRRGYRPEKRSGHHSKNNSNTTNNNDVDGAVVTSPTREGFAALDVTGGDMEGISPHASHKVPMLQHGLRRVLFRRGVHTIKDIGHSSNSSHSSHSSNSSSHMSSGGSSEDLRFPAFLSRIHHPREVDFTAIPPFVTTSKDENLHRLALEHGSLFKGSTSSMTSLLSQMYVHMTKFRPVNVEALSPMYHDMNRSFTKSAVAPVSVILRPKDGIYSIDSDGGGSAAASGTVPSNKILLDLGKSLERMLTMSEEEFTTKLLKDKSGISSTAGDFEDDLEEAYSFMRAGNIMLRSQLDCYDPELEGASKFFELKTRATVAIRLDCANYAAKTGYKLDRYRGFNFSYEREFYDLMRSGFLKYIFQTRIGRMAGVLLAYHNTAEMFGFEYVPLSEMEFFVYGTDALGEPIFNATTKMLDTVLTRVVKDQEDRSRELRIVVAASRTEEALHIYVEELPEDHGYQWLESHVPGKGYDDNELPTGVTPASSSSGMGGDSPAIEALRELERTRQQPASMTSPKTSRRDLIRSYNRPVRSGKMRKYMPSELAELIPIDGEVRHYVIRSDLAINGSVINSAEFDFKEGDDFKVTYRLDRVNESRDKTAHDMRAALRQTYRLFETEIDADGMVDLEAAIASM